MHLDLCYQRFRQQLILHLLETIAQLLLRFLKKQKTGLTARLVHLLRNKETTTILDFTTQFKGETLKTGLEIGTPKPMANASGSKTHRDIFIP
ncbi:hypothetical protein SBF1_3220003 [Candidatus Desulfosporosinus infrequens]|uniref:Uncharacterized protein n=1 Tax=Candidatus Desulfosporosinus infrequens TaxID=2043169 RepID=A0A2U3KZV6_9FIRM|nr:hypothetical protein SBF1_3220003 [Candidatus Desulfosporosinus infrequens]